MRTLAEKVNSSASTINSLEKGLTRLNVEWAERLASVFGVEPNEMMGFSTQTTPGLAEDAVAYERELQHIRLSSTQFPYKVKSQALNQIGVFPDQIVVVDMSVEAMKKLKGNDIVIAQLYSEAGATTILRQFVEPSLLITNSSVENAAIINTRTEDVTIKGIVVSAHSVFRHEDASEEDA